MPRSDSFHASHDLRRVVNRVNLFDNPEMTRSPSTRPARAGKAITTSNSIRRIAGLSVLLALLIGPVCALWAAAPAKRARPPKFSKSITDVFFPDAREKLVGPRPERAASQAALGGEPAADSPQRPLDGGASHGWKKLIAAEVLEDEIKAQQIKLGEAVQNATKFKGGDFRHARLHFSVLATLFAIDAQYDEPMRWQREAAGVRDLMARAGFNCKVGTDGSYKDAKARAEELETLVRGSSVVLPRADAEASWAKIADRPPLMQRLEQAQQQGLAPWTANSSEFSRNADKVSHEAQLIAALAAVIGRDGYEFSDDETYRELARSLETHALSVRDAVEQKDYERARRAVGEVSKACAKCHEGFRS